jgi:hypothetical protein
VPEGDVIQSDVGVDVGTEAANTFLAEDLEAQGCSFGAVGEDAEVLHGGSVSLTRCFMMGQSPRSVCGPDQQAGSEFRGRGPYCPGGGHSRIPIASTGRIRRTHRAGMIIATVASRTVPPMTATQPVSGM